MDILSNMHTKGAVIWFLPFYLCTFLLFNACSESDDDTLEEYSNWQQKNESFFMSLEDSLTQGNGSWSKWKSYTKSEKVVGSNTEYVYAKLISKGDGSVSPLYTDTVRVAYRGRLLPSTSYKEGYVFDETFTGNFSLETTDVYDNAVKEFVDGFGTALQHMVIGDRYRVYVPYTLGYGSTATTAVPAYSVLIFDLILLDIATNSGELVPWSVRTLSTAIEGKGW